jgi:dihydroxyacetone kinase-like protein
MPVTKQDVVNWFEALAGIYTANQEYLTALDADIGDADHGSNMQRGFAAVQTELSTNVPADIRAAFETAAMVLIKTVGGASGPLYGTFFLRAAAACANKTELAAADVVALFEAGVYGVQQRGKAVAEDKTMIDALLAALAAMQSSVKSGAGIPEVLNAGATAAEAGMKATIPMQARKGRASYLGPRSVGHQDPGATSSWLLIKTAAEAWHSA